VARRGSRENLQPNINACTIRGAIFKIRAYKSPNRFVSDSYISSFSPLRIDLHNETVARIPMIVRPFLRNVLSANGYCGCFIGYRLSGHLWPISDLSLIGLRDARCSQIKSQCLLSESRNKCAPRSYNNGA